MRKFWLLLGIIPLLSSCFENIEEIRLKADGSGTFTYIVNFSQSRSEINSALALDSFLGLNLPKLDVIKAKVKTAKEKLAASPGISNVGLKEDYTNYILELTGSFTSIDKLNAAAKNISVAMGANEEKINSGFSYTGNDSTFSRNVYSTWKPEVVAKIKKAAGTRIGTASYTLIIKNEKPVKTVSNARAKISPSKKAVMMKLNGTDLLSDPKLLDLKIQY